MNIHNNAKTTPLGRAEMVRRVLQEGQRASDVASAFGVSVRTVRKWVARYRAEGRAGLADRPSTPHRQPHAYMQGSYRLIARLRQLRLTALEIGEAPGFPRSTVAYALRRLGLNRLDQVTGARAEPRHSLPAESEGGR